MFVVVLRGRPAELLDPVAIDVAGTSWDSIALVATLLIVKLADTGAFFVGKSLGRTSFYADQSQEDGRRGARAAWSFAMLAAWLVRDVLLPYFLPTTPRGSRLAYLAYGASLGVGGPAGGS